jgi:hypothetical protein
MTQQEGPDGAPREVVNSNRGTVAPVLLFTPLLYLVRVLFYLELKFCFTLALATLEHAQISAVFVYSELHPRVMD